MSLELSNSGYIIFILLALILNIIISMFQLKNKYKIKEIIICLSLENVGIIVGAKIFNIITNIEIYKTMTIYEMIFRGYSFWGAILGAISGIFIFSIIYKKSFLELAKILFPNLILVYSISKIGCFFNGCCGGKILENGIQIPIQLIETIVFAILYLYIILREYKNVYQKIFLTTILFSVFKFILEFFRQPVNLMPMSISQVISIWAIIIICIWYKFLKKEIKNDKSNSI